MGRCIREIDNKELLVRIKFPIILLPKDIVSIYIFKMKG